MHDLVQSDTFRLVISLLLQYNIQFIMWTLIIDKQYNKTLFTQTFNFYTQTALLFLTAIGFLLYSIFPQKALIIVTLTSILFRPLLRDRRKKTRR